MSGAGEWLAAQQAADQRRFLNLLAGSVAAHVGFVALMGVMPAPPRSALPEVLRVDLVSLPVPPKASAARARPPAPPPPKQIVLPKRAPSAAPRKRAEPPPPEPIDYEDALSQLRSELGESPPEPAVPLESHATAADTVPQAAAPGTVVDAEMAAWQRAVSLHLRGCWITPPEFLNRRLVTELQVMLTSTGELVGAPRVTRASGDPYFDDNTLRAVVSCAPLPPPPEPGRRRFAFMSEAR
jgi:outer membrane biosynthesis protein TonB